MPLPTQHTEMGSKIQGHRQAKGVRYSLHQGEGLMTSLQGLVWKTQIPEGNSRIHQAAHARGLSIQEGMMGMPLPVIQGDTLLQVSLGSHQLPKPAQRIAECTVPLEDERWAALALCQGEQVLCQLPCGL